MSSPQGAPTVSQEVQTKNYKDLTMVDLQQKTFTHWMTMELDNSPPPRIFTRISLFQLRFSYGTQNIGSGCIRQPNPTFTIYN
jgi:hypothetical protein